MFILHHTRANQLEKQRILYPKYISNLPQYFPVRVELLRNMHTSTFIEPRCSRRILRVHNKTNPPQSPSVKHPKRVIQEIQPASLAPPRPPDGGLTHPTQIRIAITQDYPGDLLALRPTNNHINSMLSLPPYISHQGVAQRASTLLIAWIFCLPCSASQRSSALTPSFA